MGHAAAVRSDYRSGVASAAWRVTSAEEVRSRRADHQARTHRLPRRVWRRRAIWALPAGVMLVLGLLGLDRHSVWRDEAASVIAARRTLPELWTLLGQLETVHAVYYTLLHAWLGLGAGEVWVRVPSVLAMAVAAGLVGALGARLVSAPVGLAGGLLFAVDPSVSYYAQEARSTALVGACALLATWFLLRAVDQRGRWWAAYAAAGAALVGLNLIALLVPLALGVTLVGWRVPRRDLLRWAGATVPALAVAGGLVLVTGEQPNQVGWIPRPGTSSLRDLAHLVAGPTLPLVVLVGLLVLTGVWPTRSSAERRLRALALPLLVVPPAALLVVSFVQPAFVARYVFPSVAGAALLAGLGAVRLARLVAGRSARPALAFALATTTAVAVVGAAGIGAQRLERTPDSRPDDLAAAAAVIAAGAQPGDVVLFVPDNRRLLSLAYPEPFVQVRDASLAAGPEAAGNLTGRPLPLAATLHTLTESPRVWAVGRPGLALLPAETDARAELALLDSSFDAVQRTGSRGVGITLYVRRG